MFLVVDLAGVIVDVGDDVAVDVVGEVIDLAEFGLAVGSEKFGDI